MNEIIQDYGKTVTPELYIEALQGHQYIPQSDQCILKIIKEYRTNVWGKENMTPMHIIDFGCGPGRLTNKIGQLGSEYFTYGVDISTSFIEFANKNKPHAHMGYFICEDFSNPPAHSYIPQAEIILIQGVMHHMHDEDRTNLLKRCFDRLKSNGILIIGDEFIKDYENKDERIMNVAKFYLHIINEARKGGFDELAREEAKNFIDDCFAGTEFAGLATEKTFDLIYETARWVNNAFYTYGSVAGLNFDSNNQIRNLFDHIKRSVKDLVETKTENFNRGDYKISVEKFIHEMSDNGFRLKMKHLIGPVEQLGGMGVLVFKKC